MNYTFSGGLSQNSSNFSNLQESRSQIETSDYVFKMRLPEQKPEISRKSEAGIIENIASGFFECLISSNFQKINLESSK